MIYRYLPVEAIHYGKNVVSCQLTRELNASGSKNVLVVTTASMRHSKAFEIMINILEDNFFNLYLINSKQHVPSDILMKDIKKIYEFNPDTIISCGGGSSIDAGKIFSLILSEKIQTEDELYEYSENIKRRFPEFEDIIPHFTIPTTLSASEFTCIAGTTNSKNQLKYKFSHISMTPKFVFLDPIFTIDTPEWLFLSTGIRAVDHAVETLYSPEPNPINTSLALDALRKLYINLPLVKKHPDNLNYRLECQIGAWLSLFSNINIKLGLSHSIGHQIGASYNIPHGMTSAIMLPHVMKYLLPRTYEKQKLITEAIGQFIYEKDDMENAKKAALLIKELIKMLDVPNQLRDFNLDIKTIPKVVNNILKDIDGEQNEFVLNTNNLKRDITTLLENAW